MHRIRDRNQSLKVSSRGLEYFCFLFCVLFTFYYLFATVTITEAVKPRLYQITVEGVATITTGNYILAREIAIKNAIRTAVENSVKDFVKDLEGQEVYKESLEEGIYKNGEDFIQSYKILGEMKEKDTYTVVLSINIFEDSIKKRLLSLGITSAGHSNLRILIIIEERIGISLMGDDFLSLYSIAEDTLSKKLSEVGFEVVNRNTVRNKIDVKEIRKAISGDEHIASVLGKHFNTNAVIFGNANVTVEAGKVQAEINTKVFSVGKETLIIERNEVTTILTTDKILGTAQSLRDTADKITTVLIDFLKKNIAEQKPD
ncbi:MAG: flagellar assembly protein T N-terminal domain-containing protein [Nitrospinae bacterium]|nr:flagellar assembly protein T N-terminal domain-containing protein [Nitrospinota bacterium]